MTKHWVSQVVSSLGNVNNRIIDTISHRKLLIKTWYNFEYC